MFRRRRCIAATVVLLTTFGILLTAYYMCMHNNAVSIDRRDTMISTDVLWNLRDQFPHIMIIGFGKAGTRALYEALKLHPQLTGPQSEKRFFSQHYSDGLVSYLKSLPTPPNGGHSIEKSPDYIITPKAPPRILSAVSRLHINPASLKFIVVLRDPVDRAVSEYLEWVIHRKKSHGPPLPPLPQMVLDGHRNIDTTVPYINTSCYAYHIRNWLHYFPREQLCFVDGDRFVSNPYAEVHLLEECLGLSHHFTEDNFVYSKKKGFYCFMDTQKEEDKLQCMGKSKGRKHPKLPNATRKQLYSFYRPWNMQVAEITNRRYSFNVL